MKTLILLPLLALHSSLLAATFYVDESPIGTGNNGTSWTNAYTDLQSALAVATDGDEIHVATGTYYPDDGFGQVDNDRDSTFQLITGVRIYGGYPSGGGSRDVTGNPTILSGDIDGDTTPSNNAHHVLTGSGTNTTAILDGVTISAGMSDLHGGGLYNASGSPTISNCLFINNSANSNGGAIYNISSSNPDIISASNPNIISCSFSGNTAGEYGGAVFNGYSSPTISTCTFSGNTAIFKGGAIYNGFSSPTVSNSSFSGHVANYGGAIYNHNSPSSSFINCAFSGNRAYNQGGAMTNFRSSPTLINCTFTGNNSDSGGSAMENYNSSSALTNCIVWNNHITNSAFLNSGSTSAPTFSHCLIEGITDTTLNDTGTGNLDGTDTGNNPLFLIPIDPATAPTTAGNLHFFYDSPAINAGDGISGISTNTTTTDLDGNARFFGAIDLGCYEGGVLSTFATRYPGLNANDDANGNGISNYMEYAMGADPAAPHDPSLLPSISGTELTMRHRAYASDVIVTYQKSTDLIHWDPMIFKTDYGVNGHISGIQSNNTLHLTIDPEIESIFFRQKLSPTE